jgi:hypothetical protein
MKEIADKIERPVKTYCGGEPHYVEWLRMGVDDANPFCLNQEETMEAIGYIEALRKELKAAKENAEFHFANYEAMQQQLANTTKALNAAKVVIASTDKVREFEAIKYRQADEAISTLASEREANAILTQQLAECAEAADMGTLGQLLSECQARERAIREAAIEVVACTTPINRNAELARLKKAMPLIIQSYDSTALDTLKKQWQREAFKAGYARGHNDTVEGCYNSSCDCENECADEWMAKELE